MYIYVLHFISPDRSKRRLRALLKKNVYFSQSRYQFMKGSSLVYISFVDLSARRNITARTIYHQQNYNKYYIMN